MIRKIAEKLLRRCGIVVVAQHALQLRQASNILPVLHIPALDPLKELRGVAQLLEGDPELVAGIGVEPSKMRALPEGLAVQPRQDPGGKCRSRFQQDCKRIACQLVSPASGLDPAAQRQLKPVVARTGKRIPQCGIGDRAVRLGSTTQAVEIDGIQLEALGRPSQRLGNEDIPVARRTEQLRQPFASAASPCIVGNPNSRRRSADAVRRRRSATRI